MDEAQKRYRTQMNIGRAKYVVSHHDGEKQHADGSAFYDCVIFSNKRKMTAFIKQLEAEGYSHG